MMNLRIFVLLFIPSVLSAATTFKSDHLLPCDSPFSDPYAMVEEWHGIRAAVSKGFDYHADVGFYCIPAFTGPYAFQIQSERGRYQLVGNELATSFTSILDGDRLVTNQFRKGIDSAIARRVHAIWKTFLLECRFPTLNDVDGEGMDGAHYYFTARTEFGRAAGTTWSPDKDRNPKLHLLVSLADSIFAYLKSESADTRQIESQLEQLERLH